jgi:hypothetical protein
MSIDVGVIGATPAKVYKPKGTVGSASDSTAPFALGMTLTCTPVDAPKLRTLAKFCRVGSTSISSTGSAGITSGVTVATASGNTWVNETGVDLVEGDYVFLTTAPIVT